MMKNAHYLFLVLIVLAVSAVAIADVLLKKASALGSVWAAIKSPWMALAITLYLFQIFFFTYVFVNGLQLAIVGILQTALYAIIILAASFFLFGEQLSSVQTTGIVLAIAGVVLMNIR